MFHVKHSETVSIFQPVEKSQRKGGAPQRNAAFLMRFMLALPASCTLRVLLSRRARSSRRARPRFPGTRALRITACGKMFSLWRINRLYDVIQHLPVCIRRKAGTDCIITVQEETVQIHNRIHVGHKPVVIVQQIVNRHLKKISNFFQCFIIRFIQPTFITIIGRLPNTKFLRHIDLCILLMLSQIS